jgi:hypothetical protein
MEAAPRSRTATVCPPAASPFRPAERARALQESDEMFELARITTAHTTSGAAETLWAPLRPACVVSTRE